MHALTEVSAVPLHNSCAIALRAKCLQRESSHVLRCVTLDIAKMFSLVRENIDKTLRNDAIAPLKRLRAWVDLQIRFVEKADMRNGCLIGNYSAFREARRFGRRA